MAKLVSDLTLQPDVGAALVQVWPEQLPQDMRLLAGWDEAQVLAGHMTASEFQAYRDFHNPGLQSAERRELSRQHVLAREATSALDPVATGRAFIERLEDDRTNAIAASPAFADAFGALDPQFAWVVPHLIVPSQAYVKINARGGPPDGLDLFQISFPELAQPKFEVVSGPPGVFYLVSSSPHVNVGQPIVKASTNGIITVSLGVHLNFVLVANLGDVYYGRNGTHRLEWATRTGIDRLPALIIRARSIREAAVQLGVDGFSMQKLANAKRPPLIGDFRTQAAMPVRTRRSNYGWTVRTRGLRRR